MSCLVSSYFLSDLSIILIAWLGEKLGVLLFIILI